MRVNNEFSLKYGRVVSSGPAFEMQIDSFGHIEKYAFRAWLIMLNVTDNIVSILVPGPRNKSYGVYSEFGYVVVRTIKYGYSRRVSLFKKETVTQRMALDEAVKYVTEHQSSLEDVETNIAAMREIKDIMKDL